MKILVGDCRTMLATLPDASVQCVVTSPPYYGLRDYGVDGQIGLEQTPDAYVAEMVGVFREVRRALRDDGTLWLNLGDSYASNWPCNRRSIVGSGSLPNGKREARPPRMGEGLKDKDLIGIPWLVAFALRADGWWLRSDIIWAKPNPMPESVTDRPTSAHEHVFLLSKRDRYFYDADAVREEPSGRTDAYGINNTASDGTREYRKHPMTGDVGANRKNVWTIATQPYSGAHFATMPPDLAERCIKAGSKPGDTVLDPFGGSGTTALVASLIGREAVMIELNPEYADLAKQRIDAALLQGDTKSPKASSIENWEASGLWASIKK